MAWSKVQSRSASSGTAGTSRALAFVSNNTAGNMLKVSVSIDSATVTISSVVDSVGNAWTAIGTFKVNGNNRGGQIYYAKNCLSGANTVTVNYSGSATNGIAIAEYSGLDTSTPLRGHAEAIGTSATPSSGALDVAPVAGDLLIGLALNNSNPTAGSGYTIEESNFGWLDFASYEDKTAVSETSVDWSNGASTWACFGAAFKLAVAAPTAQQVSFSSWATTDAVTSWSTSSPQAFTTWQS